MVVSKKFKSKTLDVSKQKIVLNKPLIDYKKKTEFLEEEILRKQKRIEELEEQNKLLLKTVLKAQDKLVENSE